MSHQKKLANISKSRIKLSEDGLTTEESNSSSLEENTGDTLSPTNLITKKSSTVVSHRKNNTTIYEDKSNSCNKSSHNTNSSLTSVVESTTKEKAFSPFYEESSKVLFQKLPLALPTDSLDSDSTSLNGFLKNSDVKSFVYKNESINLQNKNCLKTYYQSLQSSQLDTTDPEDTLTRSRKIRLFPTTKQKEYFNKCFGTTRYLYNKTIHAFKQSIEKQKDKFIKKATKTGCIKMMTIKTKSKSKSGSKTKKKVKTVSKQCCKTLHSEFFCKKHSKSKVPYRITTNFVYWRNKLVKPNNKLSDKEKWLKDMPFDTRQLAIRNALGGIKSAFTNLKRGHIKHFDMKFKSKKKNSQLFFIDFRALKSTMHLWKKLEEPLRFKKKEKKWIDNLMKKKGLKNMTIIREKTGKYFMLVPYVQRMHKKKPEKKVVSIDPGVITFHTFYSPDGECGKIGDGLSKSFEKHNELICETQSHIANLLKGKNEMKKEKPSADKTMYMKLFRKDIKRLRKKLVRIRSHIKNSIKDMHQKAIKYYCENYKYIILPDFDAVRIARKFKRQGMHKQARKTMELSHRTFIQRLKTKVNTYENCRLFLVGEHYTSQTCGKCGILNKNIGRDRILNCFDCKYNADRDMNAARNILINHAHSLNHKET